MKARKAKRYTAQYPGQQGGWHGTCPVWASGFPSNVTVNVETVLVVNPHREACGACNGFHIIVPARGGQ